ncbi:TIGR02466 family protein [Henriciella aquimarina]|uniref:TIGR02466 family protein n=1 Tax=Henriciella aquimarina TaxID=545261 RepID=UPI000A01DD22|nr:TIGR02466 family protein [Henriciella aquimarina]
MTSRLLFPTHLFETRLSGAVALDELEDACWMIEDGDTAGHTWCEEKGYPGYTSYASLDDLPQRAPAFGALADLLTERAEAFARELYWDIDPGDLTLDAFWINILGEGGQHSGHLHPGSVISGTVYVAMPDGAGDIRFEDPRLAMMMAAPAQTGDVPESARRFVYLAPQPGDILMWESWLRHEVMPSRTEEPRISVSFNFGLKR